jgi:hypothetical protein
MVGDPSEICHGVAAGLATRPRVSWNARAPGLELVLAQHNDSVHRDYGQTRPRMADVAAPLPQARERNGAVGQLPFCMGPHMD